METPTTHEVLNESREETEAVNTVEHLLKHLL